MNKTKSISSPEKPEIPGYSLEEVIYESSRTRLWRGKRQSDGLLVLIKGAVSPQQSAQELAEIRHEHEITQAPEIDRVLKSRELAAIEFLAVTDNVVELLIDRLQGFSDETRRLLSLAACIGNTFNLESLQLISGAGSGEIYDNLLPALESGLITGSSRAPQPNNPPAGATADD